MIRNPQMLDEFERFLIQAEPPDYFQNLRIVEALYREACALGVWPPQDPLEGIEVDIELARMLNVRTAA